MNRCRPFTEFPGEEFYPSRDNDTPLGSAWSKTSFLSHATGSEDHRSPRYHRTSRTEVVKYLIQHDAEVNLVPNMGGQLSVRHVKMDV